MRGNHKGDSATGLVLICLLLLVFAYVVPGSPLYHKASPAPGIDGRWVAEFMGNASAARMAAGEPAFVESDPLNAGASQRLSVMLQDPDIAHFGEGLNAIELVFYPEGFSPSSYLSYVQTYLQGHYSDLLTPGLSLYGFALGEGPTYQVNAGCPSRENSAGQNVTAYFQSLGCQVRVVRATWLVIELA